MPLSPTSQFETLIGVKSHPPQDETLKTSNRGEFVKPVLTKRLMLRDFEETDWKPVQDYASDPEVVRYVDFGPNSEEESRIFYSESA